MNYYTEVLKKYAVFSGRARRKEYWMFLFFNLIAYVILAVIDHFIGIPLLAILYGLAVLCPSIAVSVRRLHDTNHSGWWLLLGLIPLIGAIVILIFQVTDSQSGVNQYGPNTKEM